MTMKTMPDVSVDVPSPLRESFLRCEVECVLACCGIDAISVTPDLVVWGREVGLDGVEQARHQLSEIIAVVEDRRHKVGCEFLNFYTATEEYRQEVLVFLREFEKELASLYKLDKSS